jgi:hypothetical protein
LQQVIFRNSKSTGKDERMRRRVKRKAWKAKRGGIEDGREWGARTVWTTQ